MKKVSVLLVVIAVITTLVLSLGISCAPKQNEAVTWKFYGANPADYWVTKLNQRFAQEVNTRTNGQLAITVFPARALGYKSEDTLTILSKSLVPIGETAASWVSGSYPEIGVFALPFLVSDWREAARVAAQMRGVVSKQMEKKLNIKWIASTGSSSVHLFTRKPIKTLDDLKGLKVRVNGDANIRAAKELGMVPVPLENTEINSALERGTIDAVFTVPEGMVSSKRYELLKYYTVLPLYTDVFMILVSKSEFDRLPKASQNAVLQVADKYIEWGDNAHADVSAEAEVVLRMNGVTKSELSSQDMTRVVQLTKPIVDDWAAKYGSVAKDFLNEAIRIRDK